MKCALYARVSVGRDRQDPDMQLNEMREYCKRRDFEIAREFVDVTTGSKDNRPGLNALMRDARRRKFDAVVVYRFDRFARSSVFLITSLNEFQSLSINFISLHEGIDTSTPTGKFTFTIIAALAEFERSLIQERVKSGLYNAKMKGKHIGRPRVNLDLDSLNNLKGQGKSIRYMAKMFQVSPSTVSEYLKLADRKP